MSVERRDQWSLNLLTCTSPVFRDRIMRHKGMGRQKSLWPNRWERIGSRALEKDAVFNNLLTHINVETLGEAFHALHGKKAEGIDGIRKEQYGKNLDKNLKELVRRIHRGSYKPQNRRERLIPKSDVRKRPIAIACFEDKLVEWVISQLLTIIYEPLFIRNSFGFQPNKSAHEALKAAFMSLKDNNRPYVVEIDFANFFNTIPHKGMMKALSKRISDRRFKGLIGRFLTGGLLERFGLTLNMEKTHAVDFNRTQNNDFSFLGFTIYWGEKKKYRPRPLKFKTRKKSLHRKMQEFEQWIKANRSAMRLAELWKKAGEKLKGHYVYFGLWTNYPKLHHFYSEPVKSLFKWLNRRSQKRSYTWEAFERRLENLPLPKPPSTQELKCFGRRLYA